MNAQQKSSRETYRNCTMESHFIEPLDIESSPERTATLVRHTYIKFVFSFRSLAVYNLSSLVPQSLVNIYGINRNGDSIFLICLRAFILLIKCVVFLIVYKSSLTLSFFGGISL